MVKYSSQDNSDEMLINGEMFLVEHEEDSKAQLFRLCTKYFVLQVILLRLYIFLIIDCSTEYFFCSTYIPDK